MHRWKGADALTSPVEMKTPRLGAVAFQFFFFCTQWKKNVHTAHTYNPRVRGFVRPRRSPPPAPRHSPAGKARGGVTPGSWCGGRAGLRGSEATLNSQTWSFHSIAKPFQRLASVWPDCGVIHLQGYGLHTPTSKSHNGRRSLVP